MIGFELGRQQQGLPLTACLQIAAQQHSLSTLASLLLNFLPSHLLPVLPASTAPDGVPTNYTPHSTIARRQAVEYPVDFHPGPGSTSRIAGAHGMVMEHRELMRSRTGDPAGPLPRHVPVSAGLMQPSHGGAVAAGKKRLGGIMAGFEEAHPTHRVAVTKEHKEKDPVHKHPNQYTKRRLAAEAAAAAAGGASPGRQAGGSSQAASGMYGAVTSHPLGLSAVDSVKEKRRVGGADLGGASRASSVASFQPDEAGGGVARMAKRKLDEVANASKRRKKASVFSCGFAGSSGKADDSLVCRLQR